MNIDQKFQAIFTQNIINECNRSNSNDVTDPDNYMIIKTSLV